MASFSDSDGKYTLTVYAEEKSYDVTTNSSRIEWSLYFASNSSYHFNGYSIAREMWFDNSKQLDYSSSGWTVGQGQSVKIGGGTSVVYHNQDGSKTTKVWASATVGGSASFLPSRKLIAQGDLKLSNIPRTSKVSVSNPKPKFGETVTINIIPAQEDFTHKLWVGHNNHISWTLIGDNVKTELKWTVPKDYAYKYTDADKSLWLWVNTYKNDKLVGETKLWDAFQLQATSDMMPTGNISIYDTRAEIRSLGTYVKGESRLAISASGSAKYGANLKYTKLEYENFEIKQGITPETAGKKEIKATFTDSRNNQTVITKSIDVYDYKPPKIKSVQFIQGKTSIEVKISGEVDSIKGKNTKKLVVKYKAKGESYFKTRDVYLSSWSFSEITTITGIDSSHTYEFEVVLSDLIGSDTKTNTTGIPVISRLAGGKGVRLFGEAEAEGFWVGNIDYTITDKEYAILMEMLS